MQTLAMPEGGSSCPCLEYFPERGSAAHKVPLDKSPFIIGRIETVDLQLDSTRVSREHAQIVAEGGSYKLEDLGSTNGTFVNGESVKETFLEDGDIVLIADMELSFVAATTDRFRRMATQPIQPNAQPRNTATGFGDALNDMRRMQETVLLSYMSDRLLRVETLGENAHFGHYATRASAIAATKEFSSNAISPDIPCPLAMRFWELARTVCIDDLRLDSEVQRVFVDVATWEVEGNPRLLSHLARLNDLLPNEATIVVTLDADSVVDLQTVQAKCEGISAAGMEVCLREFLGGGPQVMQLKDIAPDFLMLSASLFRRRTLRPQQQEQMHSLVDACQVLGCRPILMGVTDSSVEDSCQELGFDLTVREPSTKGTRPASREPVACAV